jgi:hypothetical protein
MPITKQSASVLHDHFGRTVSPTRCHRACAMLTHSLATGLSFTKANESISIENRWFDPDVVRRAVSRHSDADSGVFAVRPPACAACAQFGGAAFDGLCDGLQRNVVGHETLLEQEPAQRDGQIGGQKVRQAAAL